MCDAVYGLAVMMTGGRFRFDESAIQAWYEEPKRLSVVAPNVILSWLFPPY